MEEELDLFGTSSRSDQDQAPQFGASGDVSGGAGGQQPPPRANAPAQNFVPTPPNTSFTYRIENNTGDDLEFYYQAPDSVYKNVTVFSFSNREVCAIPNTFTPAQGLEVTQLSPCNSPDGGTPSTPGGTTAPVDSMGAVPGTEGPGGTRVPVTATKFNLRIISANAAGSTQKYVINGAEYSEATTYQFDINDFKSSVEVIPKYNDKLYRLKNSFRIQRNGDRGLAIYETQKSTRSESNRFFQDFPTDIRIEFNYEPFTTNQPPTTFEGININLDGPSDSAVANIGNTIRVVLKSGNNAISAKSGDNISIQSSDSTYRVSNIRVQGNTETKEATAQSLDESVSINVSVNGGYEISVKSENYTAITAEQIPSISFIGDSNRGYNINSDSGVAISFRKGGGVNRIRASVNGREFTFSDLGDGPECILVLTDEAFPNPGQYKAIFVPSNQLGDGNAIESSINAFADIWVGVPDIRDIVYPSVLRGPDYVGTDVDFEISYKSVNADFVRISKDGSDRFIQGPSSGLVKLNVQQILDLDNTVSSEDEDKINITLKLVPYNTSGFEVVVGKEEYIVIAFDKGDLTIPRPVALNRIADGFFQQFNTSVFEDETSKYLTHLLHMGNGDNKVITTWVGSESSLILKLYEPLPQNFQTNQQVWISKPQSNPIVETITISSELGEYCPPLKGPNFLLEVDNGIGYKVFDDLIASGSFTSTDIVNTYLEGNGVDTSKLKITYSSGSTYLFENFVHFGSAEERVSNFFYKFQLIENYKLKYEELTSETLKREGLLAEATHPLYLTNDGAQLTTEEPVDFFDIYYETAIVRAYDEKVEAARVYDKLNELLRGFDGFEKWLYSSLDDLAYPKTLKNIGVIPIPTYVLDDSDSVGVVAWYESLISLAAEYDKYNPNYLVNNVPEFIREDYESNDFIVFLDMIGQHFDILWVYINGLKKNKLLEESQIKGATNNLIYYLLESMGWEGKRAFDSQFLWEYAFGTNKEGHQKFGMPLSDANNQVWRRILNNLPYLLKHKGTGRAMKAVMACYGVPQSMLTIMEFGGPQDPTSDGTTKFTFDDRTAAIKLQNDSSIVVPWKVAPSSGAYPQGIEFRILPDSVKNTTIISSSQFKLDIIQTTGSFAKLEFTVDTQGSSGPYVETPFTSASVSTTYFDTAITYVLGPETVSGSFDFPLSTEHYSNILLNRYDLNAGSLYEILLKTSDGNRVITSVSMSFVGETVYWNTGSALSVGNNFDGNLDEFRLWRVPLQPSKLENHTLHPDAINGNSYTASTADLLFRLDFEYPKDRTNDIGIKNVSINTTYAESFASASNMYSASVYPYQYIPYDRTVTATVPSLGFNVSNKIRFEEQTLVGDLSHKARATKKSFDRAPIDSNRLGIFMSPIKELNMDIVKAFGDFNIDNYIGDPSDEYRDSYKELGQLRTYYFQRLERNIYEYIQLVRYIDKSLFDVLTDLAPARAKVSKGLLIEPHYLERNKVRWDKPVSLKNDYDSTVDASQYNEILSSYETKYSELDAVKDTFIESTKNDYNTIITADEIYSIESEKTSYDTLIDTNDVYLLESDYPTYPPTGSVNIECPTGATLTGEVDSFTSTLIGLDPNSLANAGFGLYAENGNGVVTKLDTVFGNHQTTGSRSSIFLIKEQYNTKISTQLAGWPVNGSMPGDQVYYEDINVTNNRFKVSIIPFSGSVAIGNDVVEVTALNGYFPTHYKFVNNLSEGLQRSYWKGSLQTSGSTPDGLDPVEIFTTNPNILRVANTGRGSGEPILVVE